MNDFEQWQQANDAYLAAALEWLRLRLIRLAPKPPEERPAPPPPPSPAPPQPQAPPAAAPPPPKHWWQFRRGAGAAAAVPPQKEITAGTPAPPALPPAPDGPTDQQLRDAESRMRAAEGGEHPPALTLLMHRFDMQPFERDVLLLCVAMELDTGMGALCARAQDDPARPFPTFALAMTLFDEPSWEAMAPERPLRYWRLVEIGHTAGQPLTASPLRADERIVNYAKGLSHVDERVMPFLVPFDHAPARGTPPPSQQTIVRELVKTIERQQAPGAIYLLGSDRESKQVVAGAIADALGVALYRMTADLLPSAAADLDTLARLWRRDSLLSRFALYLDAHDVDRNAEAVNANVRRFVSRAPGLLFVDAREATPGVGMSIDVAKPTPGEQRALWTRHLGEGELATASTLAAQFNLSAPAIERIAVQAKEQGSGSVLDRAWSLSATATRPRIDALAQRIDVRATWDDLVLPETELGLLRQISAQVSARTRVYDEWGFRERMNRGLGIASLFAGESGTGKTMAAEVIANELRLPLHRIDLSAVVSKYIGETEKNVREVFERAEDGGGILFFDEADALYGKRTEVRDSHDRYANIEINYLLQRMESYRGVVILATNMKDALDTAFLRRIRFIVQFAFPDPTLRREIWRRAFPDRVPRDVLDLERLARLSLTGGSIHNIALNASFLASASGSPVTMPIVLEAARTEMRKLGKPINEADFRWREPGMAVV